MAFRARHGIADGATRLLAAPAPGGIQAGDELAGAGEAVDQEDFGRRQAGRQLAAGLRVGAVAVGADGEALRGQPLHGARTLEASARQHRQVGEAHAARLRDLGLDRPAEVDGDGGVMERHETRARLLQGAIDEAAARMGGGRGGGLGRHGGHISCRLFSGS
jgi:hypothetical protein